MQGNLVKQLRVPEDASACAQASLVPGVCLHAKLGDSRHSSDRRSGLKSEVAGLPPGRLWRSRKSSSARYRAGAAAWRRARGPSLQRLRVARFLPRELRHRSRVARCRKTFLQRLSGKEFESFVVGGEHPNALLDALDAGSASRAGDQVQGQRVKPNAPRRCARTPGVLTSQLGFPYARFDSSS